METKGFTKAEKDYMRLRVFETHKENVDIEYFRRDVSLFLLDLGVDPNIFFITIRKEIVFFETDYFNGIGINEQDFESIKESLKKENRFSGIDILYQKKFVRPL